MISTSDAASTRTLAEPGGLRHGHVRLASGVSLSFIERGSRGAPTLVLLHGLSDSCRSFEPLLEHLPPSLHVIVPSLRGHGDSDRPMRGYALADFARDLRELLASLGLESAVIAGHSLGASVALKFALAHPQLTRGLVLLGAFARYRNNPAIAELAAVIDTLNDPVDGAFVRDFQRATLTNPVAPAFLEQVIRESRRVPARVWKAIIEALLGPDAELPLADVRAPTLLLSGERDVFVPREDQQRLLASIPGCRSREYPGGHGFHWEMPALVADDLAAFSLECNAVACPGQP